MYKHVCLVYYMLVFGRYLVWISAGLSANVTVRLYGFPQSPAEFQDITLK
jgi:hypothetical protein